MGSSQEDPSEPEGWVLRSGPARPPSFSFSVSDDSRNRFSPLDIRCQSTSTIRSGVKRRRSASDVDGFNTAGLSVKKRRLRTELITSRLSQPYSQPATHILNREGQEAGDKRFLKMATSVDQARRVAHLQATSFLRFSTMNCLRKRLSLGQLAGSRKHEQEMAAIASKATGKPAWRSQILQDPSMSRSLRICPTGAGIAGHPSTMSSTKPQPSPLSSNPSQHSKPTACRSSKPAALTLPDSDATANKKRKSPQLFPVRSPELKPTAPLPPLDDLEEDSFAYMHPTDDDWDDVGDDQDSVYSDFSVLFGQSSDDKNEEEERSYEDYLDELDGICWVSR
ncbi:hypothetical protein F66182_3184 [Fusarium sp. NRRL 66182]|nr:hypothetical protein F66182_3184 [Fusarium sp. NRRL 66182]